MAVHPSLVSSDKSAKARSVLKRAERLKIMMEKGKWKEGDDVYDLPKIKTVRIKIKKEKAEKAAETTAAVPGTTPEAAGAPAAKEAPAKGTAGKASDKK